jgi:serine/threonine-protein kinase
VQIPFLLALTIAMLGAAVVGLSDSQRAGPRPPRPAQAAITLPAGDRFTNAGRHLVAVSPDGTRLVYVANNRLYLRTIGRNDTAPIGIADEPGGASPRNPFFSPDGRWVGFWQNRQLRKVSVAAGPPVALCAALNPQGASWTTDDTILFGQGADGIWRVSGRGGTPEQVVKVEPGQLAHGPQLLPGGRAVLFTVARGNDWDTAQAVVQSLESGTRRVAVDRAMDARYVSTGHIVYAIRGALLAMPFDVAALEPRGPAVRLVDDVAQAPTGVAQFAIASSGALVYVPADAVDGNPVRTLVWVDRQGVEEPIEAPARWYFAPRVSPDGTRVALEIDNDIWILDLTRHALTRVTDDPAFELVAIWTPDGRDVIFSSGRSGRSTLDPLNLFRRAADGTGATDRLTEAPTARQVPYAATPDGTALIFREHGTDPSGDPGDLMLMPLVGRRESRPLVQTKFREMNAELSPDGRWLAFQSNESGRDEIYVRPFPDVSSGKWRVSSAGGMRPLWARNGRELFYESAGGLMRVALTIGATLDPGTPSRLFDGPYFYNVLERMFDVSPDGRRFLMIKESKAGPTPSARFVVVQDWVELIRPMRE